MSFSIPYLRFLAKNFLLGSFTCLVYHSHKNGKLQWQTRRNWHTNVFIRHIKFFYLGEHDWRAIANKYKPSHHTFISFKCVDQTASTALQRKVVRYSRHNYLKLSKVGFEGWQRLSILVKLLNDLHYRKCFYAHSFHPFPFFLFSLFCTFLVL